MADRRIGKSIGRNRSKRVVPKSAQRLNRPQRIFPIQGNHQIDIRRKAGMPMSGHRQAAYDEIAHAVAIEGIKDLFQVCLDHGGMDERE